MATGGRVRDHRVSPISPIRARARPKTARPGPRRTRRPPARGNRPAGSTPRGGTRGGGRPAGSTGSASAIGACTPATPLGFLNTKLYSIAAGSGYGNAFDDVTSGNDNFF